MKRIRRLLANFSFMIFLIVLVLVVSVLVSYYSRDWSWFSRSGSLVALFAGLLAVRKFIRLDAKELVKDSSTIDGGGYEIKADKELELDIKAAIWGILFVSLGTIIGAYGDLIGRLYQDGTLPK